jgi:hypothetical protein
MAGLTGPSSAARKRRHKKMDERLKAGHDKKGPT